MSHEFDSGMFANGKPAWHGLGTVLEHVPTSGEAMEAAGLTWEVNKQQLFAEVATFDADGVGLLRLPTDAHAIIRQDNNSVLGTVGPDYTPIQNRECFAFMDKLRDDGLVEYESCGSLKEGRVIWLLARLPETSGNDITGNGDIVEPYILMVNSHDGTMSVRIQPTAVRVVCWNTLSLAVYGTANKRKDLTYTFRHTQNVAQRIEAARKAIKTANEGYTQYIDDARKLANIDLYGDKTRKEDIHNFMVSIFPEMGKSDVSTRAQNKLEHILSSWMNDPRNIAANRGSAWGLYNAVTQYIDHERMVHSGGDDTKAKETRLADSWLGKWNDAKATAWTGIRKLALV